MYVCMYVRMHILYVRTLYVWWMRRNIYVSYVTVRFLDPLSTLWRRKSSSYWEPNADSSCMKPDA
jgi:hypothetical protein